MVEPRLVTEKMGVQLLLWAPFKERRMNMEKIIDRLEVIGNKILDAIDEKPLKTIVITILAIWIIGKIVKSLRR